MKRASILMKALRSMSVLLVSTLLLSSVAACADNGDPEDTGSATTTTSTATADETNEETDEQTTESSGPSETDGETEAPVNTETQDETDDPVNGQLSETPITFTVLTTRWASMGDSFAQNQWLIDLEERTNVHPEWQVQSLNDWSEQKGIMLAGGELPDIALGMQTFNDTDIMTYRDYFVELSSLIEEHMPNLSNAMEEKPELRNVVTYPDGSIYSLPKNLPSRPKVSGQLIINQTWLDTLNLEVPTNIDEFVDVLTAFKNDDPNQNGANDEIPITGSGDIHMDLLNPFGITDVRGEQMLVNDDGSVTYYPTSEQYKEGIKWLEELYAEGLMDPEIFTQDDAQMTAKRQDPEIARVGMSYEWSHDAVFGQWSDQYTAIQPIEGPDGRAYAGGDENGISSITRNAAELFVGNEHPEIAARWLDEFYTGEASIQNFWGAIDTVISANDDGTFTLNDPPEGISADAWYWDQSLRDFGPKYISDEFQSLIKLSPNSGDGLKLEISKMAEPFATPAFPLVMYTPEEIDEMSVINADISPYLGQMRAQWITNGTIEDEWDDYLNQLEAMGVNRLIEIRTAAYERYQEG